MTPALFVIENHTQPSLRDLRIEASPFPALKRRAKFKGRSAAEERIEKSPFPAGFKGQCGGRESYLKTYDKVTEP